ncbi:MAG: hypothetical protein J4F41_01580 [Alphaproteobacteria bacterium]|nr:hypothetical protein [Alphaproteobacteria bacterium]
MTTASSLYAKWARPNDTLNMLMVHALVATAFKKEHPSAEDASFHQIQMMATVVIVQLLL